MKKLDETAFTERELKIFKEIQEYAKKYQVRLYRDGDSVGSAYTTTNNYYNFCGSFTKEGS